MHSRQANHEMAESCSSTRVFACWPGLALRPCLLVVIKSRQTLRGAPFLTRPPVYLWDMRRAVIAIPRAGLAGFWRRELRWKFTKRMMIRCSSPCRAADDGGSSREKAEAQESATLAP